MLPFGNSAVDFPGGLPVEGPLLADVLSGGAIAPEAAFRYALEIGAAIDRAHFRGLVHGSLSTHSIAITPAGARVLRPRHPDPRAAAYRAPEQVRGEAPDARSDIFAFGAILYELVAGARAFALEGAALDQALLKRSPAPLPLASPLRAVAGEVIESCLEKDILVRRQRIKNAVAELKLNGSSYRRDARVRQPAAAPAAPRGAVIAFPQAAPPPAPTASSLPIHAVPSPPSALQAPAPPRMEHFLVPDMPLPAPPEPWWRRLANAIVTPRTSGPLEPAALPRTAQHGAAQRDWKFWGATAGIAILFVATAVGSAGYFRARPQGTAKRFTVPLMERLSYAATPAISPDGLQLVFPALGPDGHRMLWLQPLGNTAPSPIPGTEGAMHPFWAPDGQSVAFFSGKALKRISIHGGEPVVICPADPDAGGGAWSRAGTILFAPNTRDGLFVVPADGGKPEQLLKVSGTSAEISFLWPQFLPDGRHFLFFVLTNQESSTGVHTGALDSQQHYLALPSETNAVFSSFGGDASRRHGYLLFVRGRTLMRQAFDSRELRHEGDPTVVAAEIGPVRSLSLAPVSVSDNATLVYHAMGTPSHELAWVDRSGSTVKRIDPAGDWGPPRIAPDGVRGIAGRLNADRKTADLWLVHRDGKVDRLTSSEGHKSAPVWSPDGSRIAYLLRNERTGANDLVVQQASASGRPAVLLRNALAKLPTDWSSDGRFLLFNSNSSDQASHGDLWAIDTSGTAAGGPVLQTVSSEGFGAISPDGQWLAYHSDESGRNEVYVQAFLRVPADSPRRWRISRGGGALARWRGDGKELYYMTAGGRLMAVAADPIGSEFVFDTPHVLFQTAVIPGSWNFFDVSRDGQRFLCNLPVEWPASAPFTVVSNWTGQ